MSEELDNFIVGTLAIFLAALMPFGILMTIISESPWWLLCTLVGMWIFL